MKIQERGKAMPAIQLYPHNQVAFENLKTALQYSPRTAVIQPTGTGKSFVALALIEEKLCEYCYGRGILSLYIYLIFPFL